MTLNDIAQLRLQNQNIAHHTFTTPEQLVGWMGAIQAQDYPGAKWSIALRLKEFTDSTVEQAVAEGRIIRTWPMRGTLHFVLPEDVHWMQTLLTSRIIASAAGRHRQLGLNDELLARASAIIVSELRQNGPLIRKELMDALTRQGIDTSDQRGYHCIWWTAQKSLIYVGALRGKQPTFDLMERLVPNPMSMTRTNSLKELAKRYFTSHGPATVSDFSWWSGLSASDSKMALAQVQDILQSAQVGGKEYWYAASPTASPSHDPSVFLLPGFDEYMLGYTDRSAALAAEHTPLILPGKNGMFLATIVVDGRVVGTWKRTINARAVRITITHFDGFSPRYETLIRQAADRYGAYLGVAVDLQYET